MASKLGFAMISALMFFFIAHANVDSPKTCNVKDYGAVADGNTDDSKAFLRAWEDACQCNGRNRVLIPPGVYMVNSVAFVGPCNGKMSFLIKGVLKAPTLPALFFTDTWIQFRHVNNLTVKGGGYLDGQGAYAWKYNKCDKNYYCKPLPSTLKFAFVTNSRVHHLQSLNSKNIHFNFYACNHINITKVRLTAPEDSPNTDGIHIGNSSNFLIHDVNIGTGDDCISIVSGSRNITISEVSCGPGHGISIGSLGKLFEEENVEGINVWNSNITNTQNGARIKTWASSLTGLASDITFRGLFMNNVKNPVIIDQNYCPHHSCAAPGNSSSQVQISDVTFKDIWGTSNSKVAIKLQCSKLVPCRNVRLENIDLAYYGPGGPAVSSCSNVVGTSIGKQFPPSCLQQRRQG